MGHLSPRLQVRDDAKFRLLDQLTDAVEAFNRDPHVEPGKLGRVLIQLQSYLRGEAAMEPQTNLLKEEVAAARHSAEAAKAESRMWKSEAESLRNELRDSKSSAALQKTKLDQMKEMNIKLQVEVDSLRMQLQRAVGDAEAAKAALRNGSRQGSQGGMASRLNRSVDLGSPRSSSPLASHASSDARLISLQAQVDELRRENQRLISESSAKHRQSVDMDLHRGAASNAFADAKIGTLQTQVEELRRENSRLILQSSGVGNAHVADVTRLQGDMEAMRLKNQRLLQQISDGEVRTQQTVSHAVALAARPEHERAMYLQNELDIARANITSLADRLAAADQRVASGRQLAAELDALSATNRELQQELVAQKRKVQEHKEAWDHEVSTWRLAAVQEAAVAECDSQQVALLEQSPPGALQRTRQLQLLSVPHSKSRSVSTWRLAADQAAAVAERASQQVALLERRLAEAKSESRLAGVELESQQREVVQTRQLMHSNKELLTKREAYLERVERNIIGPVARWFKDNRSGKGDASSSPTAMSVLSRTANELERTRHEAQMSVVCLENELSVQIVETKRLSELDAQACHKIDLLQDTVNVLEASTQELRHANEDLMRKLREAELCCRDLEATMEREKAAHTARMNEMRADMESHAAHMQRMAVTDACTALQRELHERHQHELQGEQNRSHQAQEALHAELSDIERQLSVAREELSMMCEREADLGKTILEVQDVSSQLANKAESLQSELRASTRQCEKLKQEGLDREAELKELMDEKTQMTETVLSLEENIAEYRKRLKSMQNVR
eukprot:gene6606-3260_t